MKTYCRNGMIKNMPYMVEDFKEFLIQEAEGIDSVKRFFYPGDTINYALDAELVNLYDTFRDLIFEDTQQYYFEKSMLPVWVQEAGQNSDCCISAECFDKWMSACKVPHLYEHLYLVDCQFLVGTVQNLLCAMEDAFVNYYKTIAEYVEGDKHAYLTDPNGTIMMMSEVSTRAANTIETYFTKAYSILDIMCKICYEIQYVSKEFTSYKKIKSADVLWGTRKKLNVNGTLNTIFEKCDLIRTIEAIRNEIVHNGTWELNPKIFIRFQDGEVKERFMLFPDITQGHLATVKNRRHFFSAGMKVNDILPEIHAEFKRRLLVTVKMINGENVT